MKMDVIRYAPFTLLFRVVRVVRGSNPTVFLLSFLLASLHCHFLPRLPESDLLYRFVLRDRLETVSRAPLVR